MVFSAADSLRDILTRDRVTIFVFSVSSSVVHLAVFLVISYMCTHVVDTSLHQAFDRAQDVMTPCSSHTCLTDPNVLYCGNFSEVVPSFPFGSRH